MTCDKLDIYEGVFIRVKFKNNGEMYDKNWRYTKKRIIILSSAIQKWSTVGNKSTRRIKRNSLGNS